MTFVSKREPVLSPRCASQIRTSPCQHPPPRQDQPSCNILSIATIPLLECCRASGSVPKVPCQLQRVLCTVARETVLKGPAAKSRAPPVLLGLIPNLGAGQEGSSGTGPCPRPQGHPLLSSSISGCLHGLSCHVPWSRHHRTSAQAGPSAWIPALPTSPAFLLFNPQALLHLSWEDL